ncbi:N-acyl amino acid synthase, PEP-CTERM/exosortase system-associated [Marinobacter segnicrescens]|uniref:N-acyl amino acid synthase, PEP-CTERM/exosortase system-associated n=1 Tax=Marinobacter segnicrescens TaxID=430453 RepID=A0A1I0H260_9GAMM|nr:PEP-CTERM/exosortase system-associated acyltransferase [Marinobacter segnicrescens]SET77564.1 N-acyl amino acid synthase, PEP-CTERM/exosortase system-associated [Marinobacter segnicrescens]
MHTGFAFPHQTNNTENAQVTEDISNIFNSVFAVHLANSPETIDEVFAVRYQVYCIDRPFEDPNCFADKREHDDYDHRSAHSLIRHRVTGESVAAVRLVMAGDTPDDIDFPMEGPCLPHMDRTALRAIMQTPRNRVAEISRMAVSREFRRRLNEDKSASGISALACYSDAEKGKRAMPYISLGLFSAILQMSIQHGITHWMAVMEPAQLRLLKRFGVEFDHVGPVLEYHGRRRPAFTEAATLINGIKKRRPDVWSLITDDGRHLPPKLDDDYKEREEAVA